MATYSESGTKAQHSHQAQKYGKRATTLQIHALDPLREQFAHKLSTSNENECQ